MDFKINDRVQVRNRDSGFYGLQGRITGRRGTAPRGDRHYEVVIDPPPAFSLPVLFRASELQRLEREAPDA